jgi:hypothetical protein
LPRARTYVKLACVAEPDKRRSWRDRFWPRRRRPKSERRPTPNALAFVKLRVDPVSNAAAANGDLELWGVLEEREGDLVLEIEDAARSFFGEDATALVTVGRGSLLIDIVVIGYGALKIYKEVIGNLEWFKGHVEGIIRRFFGPQAIQIVGTATPSPGLVSAVPAPPSASPDRLVTRYLVLSHAALLAIVLWLLVEETLSRIP